MVAKRYQANSNALFTFTYRLTNSLLLASDWLTILVCVIWFDKERFIEKSKNMTSKIPLLLQILDCCLKSLQTDLIWDWQEWQLVIGKTFWIKQMGTTSCLKSLLYISIRTIGMENYLQNHLFFVMMFGTLIVHILNRFE